MQNKYQKQALDFLHYTNTTCKIEYKKTAPHFDGEMESRDIYKITLKNNRHTYSFSFGNSIKATEENKKPNEYDILACLTKYDPGSLEDFCYEFGYDIDSRKAEKIYNNVKAEYQNIKKLFNNEKAMEKLREIY